MEEEEKVYKKGWGLSVRLRKYKGLPCSFIGGKAAK